MSTSLLAKIKADADARVADIKAASDAAVAKKQAATDADIATLRDAAAAALEKQKAQRELVVTSKAKQAHNLALQRAKRDALDEVFAEAFKQLCEQPSDAYIATYTKAWQEAVPAGAVVTNVTAPAGRETETTAVLSAVGTTVTPVYSTAVKAGVVVTADQGVFDLTLDRRFADARPELEMEVVSALNA
ncbi:hypothetical protein KC887_04025 [Candidatus Kaiserbacteria bacterium]|nr:hypothetical protein [Candidatus Kaiserbacteria bacterium]